MNLEFLIEVVKEGREDFPILSLHPKDYSEFCRWKKEVELIYSEYKIITKEGLAGRSEGLPAE